MAVGIVIVSHSQKLAEGVIEIAGQMSGGEVELIAAGGAEDGSLGTNAVAIREAIRKADSGDGVLVLMDLGSAVLSTETALELLDENERPEVQLSNGPLVEGAVVAAVEASIGSPLDQVARVAEQAREMAKVQSN